MDSKLNYSIGVFMILSKKLEIHEFVGERTTSTKPHCLDSETIGASLSALSS